MAFFQIIEYQTAKPEEMDRLLDRWLSATEGKRTATRGVIASDRDAPDSYVNIVEFPSYEDAMRNSEMPETDQFAKELFGLCVGEPKFRNLDVRREENF
jgi:hypothetical protein